MATKGTVQYNVWKAKYDAARLRKQGQQSLFSEEQVNSLISSVISSMPITESHSLGYFRVSVPKNADPILWEKAARRATNNGQKDVSFATVRAIYNNYVKRQKEQADHILYCSSRMDAENMLEAMFS